MTEQLAMRGPVEWLREVSEVSLSNTLKAPFAIRENEMLWAAASTGYMLIAVRVAATDLAPLEEEIANKVAGVFTVPAAAPVVAHEQFVTWARIGEQAEPAVCAKCNGTRRKRCRQCRGTLRVDCRCDECGDVHQADCDACEESGQVACDCVPERRPRPGLVGGYAFDRELFSRWLVHLPTPENGRIAVAVEHEVPSPSTAILKCWTPDWRLIVMSRICATEPRDTLVLEPRA